CNAASIASERALNACGRFNVSVITPRASWLRRTTGSLASRAFGADAGSGDIEATFIAGSSHIIYCGNSKSEIRKISFPFRRERQHHLASPSSLGECAALPDCFQHYENRRDR